MVLLTMIKLLVVLALLLVGCGGSVEHSTPDGSGGSPAGGAGGEGGANCEGYLFEAGDERAVSYGGTMLELAPGDSVCLEERPECIYRGGVKTEDNYVGSGTKADPENPSSCAPAS